MQFLYKDYRAQNTSPSSWCVPSYPRLPQASSLRSSEGSSTKSADQHSGSLFPNGLQYHYYRVPIKKILLDSRRFLLSLHHSIDIGTVPEAKIWTASVCARNRWAKESKYKWRLWRDGRYSAQDRNSQFHIETILGRNKTPKFPFSPFSNQNYSVSS